MNIEKLHCGECCYFKYENTDGIGVCIKYECAIYCGDECIKNSEYFSIVKFFKNNKIIENE
jgi:hypothetical protein